MFNLSFQGLVPTGVFTGLGSPSVFTEISQILCQIIVNSHPRGVSKVQLTPDNDPKRALLRPKTTVQGLKGIEGLIGWGSHCLAAMWYGPPWYGGGGGGKGYGAGWKGAAMAGAQPKHGKGGGKGGERPRLMNKGFPWLT